MAPKQSVDDDSLAYLEACLPRKMVEAALNKLAPLKIHLAAPEENRRWIEFDPPTTVEFIKDEGIRIVTTGRFRIDIAKIEIPAQLHRIEFLVAPRIVSADKFSHAAALPIEILDADVRFIPGLIDSLIVSQVNQALTPKASQLVWRFDELLSPRFDMPESLEQLTGLSLSVEKSRIRVTDKELLMRVAYLFDVERND